MIPESETKNLREAFAGSYLEALSGYLGGIEASAAKLPALAERFHERGLDLLDLAAVHEDAIRHLAGSGDDIKKGRAFFAGVAAVVSSDLTTGSGGGALARQISELIISNQQLREEVNRCRMMEDSLRHGNTAAGEVSGRSDERPEDWRFLSRRLLAEQEEEQRLISRELHDVIAQTMTGINVRLAVLRSQVTANAIELHGKIAETEKLAEKSVEIVHQFASELHPAVLDDFGLVPALRTFVEAFSVGSGLPVEITAGPGSDELPVAIRTALYRIAREVLGRIALSHGVKLAAVSITRENTLVRMVISDDGGGSFFPDDGDEVRLDWLGMEERAAMVGGSFRIESRPGSATSVIIEIPVPNLPAESELKRPPVSTPSLT